MAASDKALAEYGMSAYDLIRTLFDFGYFFSPPALAVTLVEESDLPTLTLEDTVVKAAVRAYQEYFRTDLDQLTQRPLKFGGLERESIADGEVGDSTVLALTMPRCGLPDFPHPGAGAEEANWPETCRGDITTSYRMNLPGISENQLQQIWIASDKQWEADLDVKFRFIDGGYPNTRIYAFAASLGGSVLADQYLAQNNCGARLQGRVSTRQWTPQLLQATLTHEHGHALGLNHLQDPNATMFPSIHQASLARWGKPVASDINAAVALGYKRRTTPVPGPEPDPVPPGGTWQAIISIDSATRKIVQI